MKKLKTILGILLLGIGIFFTSVNTIHADNLLDKILKKENSGTVEIPNDSKIKEGSITFNTKATSVSGAVQDIGYRLLSIIKYLLYPIIIGMIIYTGYKMIHSMGRDEEELRKAKNQLWYFVLAMLFINVPNLVFNTVYRGGDGTLGSQSNDGKYGTPSSDNLIVNFNSGLVENIVWFLQIVIYAFAFFMFVYAGIQLITSRGREERMKEAKNKMIYTTLAMVFAGIIETWKKVAYSGNIDSGVNLFESLANLALFFAAPVALFFLGIAAYYMITANGDEEKVKKAKTIILSTAFGVFILLSSYVVLKELQGGFNFFT